MKHKEPTLPRFRVTFSDSKITKTHVIESQDEPTAYKWSEQQLKYWHKQFTAGVDTCFEDSPKKLKVQVTAL